ncbi:MAG: Panacea domain-containing protein [Desulfobaccales bacterium]
MTPPEYNPNQIADWFLCTIDRDAGDSLTHLKLQKLIYYAQAWNLALFDEPLFVESIQAWTHGPVAYSVFQRFRDSGWEALPIPETCPEFDPQTTELLNDILSIYGQLDAKHLERLTHREAPWKEARGDLPPEVYSNNIISKDSMKLFYRKLYEESEK